MTDNPTSNSHMVVAITGGIGSGKTVASDHFAQLGVPIIDTDVIARQVVEPGAPALMQLVNTFGDDIIDNKGALRRDELRKIAFTNNTNKQQLDAITHPAIRTETMAQINAVTYPYCIVVIPLLAESTFKQFIDRILVISADQEVRIQRVITRSQLSREEVQNIMQTQADETTRLDMADDVIENNSSIEDVHAQVETLHRKYLKIVELMA